MKKALGSLFILVASLFAVASTYADNAMTTVASNFASG
jgi:hypothetical protein